jgi:signal transduction histidine kinase
VPKEKGKVNRVSQRSGRSGRADLEHRPSSVREEQGLRPARRPRGGFAGFWLAPFSRRAWAEFGYALAGLPLAVVGFAVTVVTLAAGIGYAVTFVGLPLLAVSSIITRWFGRANRGMARAMLGLRVDEPAPLARRPGFFGWLRSELTDVVAWRARAYLVLKYPVAVAAFVVAAAFWVVGIGGVLWPLAWKAGVDHVMVRQGHAMVHFSILNYGNYTFTTWPRIWLVFAQGVLALLLAPWLVRAVIAVDRGLIRGLLGPVSLTERVRDLEQTRAHAVDDSAARLRSIERDLHDGAQAQIVAVAMKLGLAKEKLSGAEAGGDPDVQRARELVDTAHRTAREAINELRDLARGIHPPVLDRGLDAALSTLAARSAVPVDFIVDVPQRPSPSIETIAYFCAAELLANVAKHSGARRATLEAVHVPGLLRVRVSDDGHGGARLNAGSGLRGLAERVRTVDGRIELSSPPGGPTVVTVELPSHA